MPPPYIPTFPSIVPHSMVPSDSSYSAANNNLIPAPGYPTCSLPDTQVASSSTKVDSDSNVNKKLDPVTVDELLNPRKPVEVTQEGLAESSSNAAPSSAKTDIKLTKEQSRNLGWVSAFSQRFWNDDQIDGINVRPFLECASNMTKLAKPRLLMQQALPSYDESKTFEQDTALEAITHQVEELRKQATSKASLDEDPTLPSRLKPLFESLVDRVNPLRDYVPTEDAKKTEEMALSRWQYEVPLRRYVDRTFWSKGAQ